VIPIQTRIPGFNLYCIALFIYGLTIDSFGNFQIFGQTGSALFLTLVSALFLFMTVNLILFNSEHQIDLRGPYQLVKGFLPLILFSFFSLLIHSPNKYRYQFFLCLILFPTTLFLTAIYRNHQEVKFEKYFMSALTLSATTYLISVIINGFGNSYIFSARSISMLACVALLNISVSDTPKNLFLRVLFTSTILFSLSRTALFIAFIINSYHYFIGKKSLSKSYFGKATFSLSGIALFSYLTLLFSPIAKRFYSVGDGASLFGINVNTNGRSKVWEYLISGIEQKPLLGHGIGQAQIAVTEYFVTIAQPHNDYLRITFDLGLLGLTLWVFAFTRLAYNLQHQNYLARSEMLMCFLVLLCFAFSDNPIVYPFFIVCFSRVIIRTRNLSGFDMQRGS
jgi:O-antigen ligase